jgi:hypothetical protein
MTIFAIIPQPNTKREELRATISERFKDANYTMDGGHGWLVSASRTAQEISDDLGLTDGSNGAGIVLEVASYFGRANPNIWTWIKLHWEAR